MNFSSKLHLPLLTAILFLCCLAFSAQAAQSHRLNVFAWLDNDRVIVECNFGRQDPARNANVTLFDSVTKKELLTGKTNNEGIFSFPVPPVVRSGHGIIIDVNAGAGHRNEWVMDASELYAAASLNAGFDEAAIADQQINARREAQQPARNAPGFDSRNLQLPQSASQTLPYQAQQPAPSRSMPAAPQATSREALNQMANGFSLPQAINDLHRENIRDIIHEAMETHISPIRQHLAAQSAAGPTIADVIGGLGWIVGIFGIWMWSRARRRQKD